MSHASERKHLSDAGFGETLKYPISWTENLALLITKEKRERYLVKSVIENMA